MSTATTVQRAKAFYLKHERLMPVAFFALGFAFDVITLGRIDATAGLIQQAVYLGVIATVLSLDLLCDAKAFSPRGVLAKAWPYREAAVQFLLGGLLSVFTLFYFKSASAFTSLAFVATICGLMLLNEFQRFDSPGKSTSVRSALASLCLLSYFACVVPMAFGRVGAAPFLASVAASALVLCLLALLLKRRLGDYAALAKTRALLPAAGVHLAFVGLYFLNAIPPVPLSVRHMGIYHGITKKDGKYQLAYTRPWWKFWQNGDESFEAAPGDRIYFFVRVFSPARFRDEVRVRWFYRDGRSGWQSSDAIPLKIAGGRDEGYRGYTTKANYQPGSWRVQVETSDGRELGRLSFSVTTVADATGREFRYDEH